MSTADNPNLQTKRSPAFAHTPTSFRTHSHHHHHSHAVQLQIPIHAQWITHIAPGYGSILRAGLPDSAPDSLAFLSSKLPLFLDLEANCATPSDGANILVWFNTPSYRNFHPNGSQRLQSPPRFTATRQQPFPEPPRSLEFATDYIPDLASHL
ncbi:hypothetical protein OG21DRAFT_1489476 [Imleria badia]|nr:hypothetical protein OG21DRAFT_1489476 [Imleria badia]